MSPTKEQAQDKRKQKRKRKINYKWLAFVFLSLFLLTALLLVGFIGITLAKNYEIDESKLVMDETSTIYDQEGNEITKLFQQNRETVPIEDIPEQVKNAFIAVEDKRFYEHQGIDFRSIARALYRDIVARDIVEGGSTITQQLAKNVFLTHDRTIMRKTEEVLIAINLEQRYSKDEILEMYLNYIYFGEGAYGIQAASQTYFGKDVDELELAEIATLAALPKAPSHYSPLDEENKERSEERRRTVLALMEEQGMISAEEREEAANAELELNTQGTSENPALNTYVDMVLKEAEEKYGISRDEMYTGGYDVYTALDVNIQETMYEAFDPDSEWADELFPAPGEKEVVQGSMVMMDHQSGAVVAIMGGRDYERGNLNWATTDARDAGSSFKPISVYAPALEAGWEPYDMLVDQEITYGGGYTPQNIDGVYRGQVTMIEALARSINAPAVWLLNEIGVQTGISYAKAFGFEPYDDRLGIALGNIGASSLGMAKAFSAFANQGIMLEPYFIERIENNRGDTIAEHEEEYTQVVSTQTAWYMTEMLQRVVENGTGGNARFNHPVAGKTGTVQLDGLPGNKDVWFVGYTPYYTAAVWMGFEHPDENHVLDSSGSNHPAKLFRHVMSQAHEGKEVLDFKKPESVKDLEPPVRMQRIGDLQAFVTLGQGFNWRVDLQFTPNQDERVAYNIYRINPNSGEESLIGEKVSGGGFTDSNVQLGDVYAYEVAPVNTLTGEEGERSNRATVEVSPEYPFFRTEELDMEEFEEWLIEEGFKEEEEEAEEDEDTENGEGDEGEDENDSEQPQDGQDQGEDGDPPGGGPGPGPGRGNDNDGNGGQNSGNGRGPGDGNSGPPGQGDDGSGNDGSSDEDENEGNEEED